LPLLDKATAVVIGPGLGQAEWGQSLLAILLDYLCRQRSIPVVADADALNLLAKDPALKSGWLKWRKASPNTAAVMTPHLGEAHRLSGNKESDRFELTDQLQHACNATLLLKGPGTIIANADHTLLCPYGNAVLATAGSGDVLTGVIAALLAQKLQDIYAASIAACLHGLAADSYLQNKGPCGLVASDLPELIAAEINQLTRAQL
jgi:NAD(P)H-hydrate epimerase